MASRPRSADPQGARDTQTTTNGRASAHSAKGSMHDVELNNISSEDTKLPLPIEEDLLQLSRLGEIGAIQKLFDSGKVKATYKDEEGITALHWAAINNHYALCKYLIECGADVNAKGGESVATPVMWATQRCHYYVVNLLLQHGADPLLTDVQNYNILHLATFDGNAYLLTLLLHNEVPVDVADPQGHTPLMWAAYKGFPACVDLFLRWGANVNARDENGFAPIHWALVRGSQPCITKIIEYGADRFAETNDGKTPPIVAGEMKSVAAYHRALAECGYNAQGHTKALPMGLTPIVKERAFLSKFFFFWPFPTLFIVIYTLSSFVIYLAIPLALAEVFGMQWVATQVAQLGPSEFRALHKTPFMTGVFAGTLFWVGVRWLYTILTNTFTSHPLLNILFAVFYGFTAYFYLTAMTEDPGYVPKLGSRNQQRTVIQELFSAWKFDEENFCVQCMIRKPLRSKHCRRCGRCVAKHDHHCPWINNCVGANNLRHFFLYIASMFLGIVLFIRLVLIHLETLPSSTATTTPSSPSADNCTILPSSLCSLVNRDPFTIILALWATMQLIWVTMLLVVQLVQIARNQTTYENMKGHSMDSHAHVPTAAILAGSSSLEGAGLTSSGMGPNPAAAAAATSSTHKKKQGFLSTWKTLLGLDAFAGTVRDGIVDASSSGSSGRRNQNPFSRGVVTNCRDFWCDPNPVFGKRATGEGILGGENVNWARMYDVPLSMRSTTGRGGMRYERVGQDDV